MALIKINTSEITGNIKPMHAVNNGPTKEEADQVRGNFKLYKALNIPYARNHDASLSEVYGCGHVVDVHNIFPDFNRNPEDETAYDFKVTDLYTKTIFDAGTEVFYRLGSSIEHWVKKYGTIVPADFEKWAKICEHIIMHYTEGWADGYHWNIKYWEIWNEPDLDEDDSLNKRTWSGTAKDYFRFYQVAAAYLKSRFSHLKIGGPALAFREEWMEDFLAALTKDGYKVPMDFFSWHIYTTDPVYMLQKAARIKEKLQRYGYGDAESILNEWNYIEDWGEKFLDSVRVIKGLKGAAFTSACMCAAQNSGMIDMLMYYDARPEKIYNGLFDSNTLLPLKGYYVFKMFSELYKLGKQTSCISDDKDVYALSAAGKGNMAAMITYYTMDNAAEAKKIKIELNDLNKIDVYVLNDMYDGEKCFGFTGNELELTIEPNTVIQLIGTCTDDYASRN